MANTYIPEEDLNRFINRLHPSIVRNIHHYKQDDGSYLFKRYHGCDYRNRNGTRKRTDQKREKQCLIPTNDPYWRVTKDKYKDKGRFYLARQPARNLKWAKTILSAHCNRRRP